MKSTDNNSEKRFDELIRRTGISAPPEDFTSKVMEKIRHSEEGAVSPYRSGRTIMLVVTVVLALLAVGYFLLGSGIPDVGLPEYVKNLEPLFGNTVGSFTRIIRAIEVSSVTWIIFASFILLLLLDNLVGRNIVRRFYSVLVL